MFKNLTRSTLSVLLACAPLQAVTALEITDGASELEMSEQHCTACGNYVRHGYITSDLAGWTEQAGGFEVLDFLGSPMRNAVHPAVLDGAGESVLSQSFEVPRALLGSHGPRVWLQMNFRKLNPWTLPPSFEVTLTDGGGNVLMSENLQAESTSWRSLLIEDDLSGVDPSDNLLTLQLTAYSTDQVFDNLGLWVEGTFDQTGVCAEVAPSTVGQAVADRLEELTAAGENFFSLSTACNNLPGDENPLSRGWVNANPDVRVGPGIGDSVEFYEAIAEELRQTSATFVLSSLHFDERELSAGLSMVETFLAPAVRDLSDRFKGVASHYWPSVRLALSRKAFGSAYPGAWKVYQSLTREFNDDERPNLHLSVAEIGIVGTKAWNHTKIAVRDRQFALVGGQNWEREYLVAKRGVTPIYDLNVRLQGDAAHAADRMFERVWDRREDQPGSCQGPHCDGGLTEFPHLPPVGDYEPLNVYALGRGHTERVPWVWNLDQSADEAVITAFGAAESSIDIVQHQVHLTGGISQFAWNPIFQRLLDASRPPILVRVVISEPWGADLRISVQRQSEWLDEALVDFGEDNGASSQEIEDARCRLQFAPFRAQAGFLPDTFHNHSKFWMIDREAFYVGSQNLYPSAIGRSAVPDLNEFGFMIDQPSRASEISAAYWDVVWAFSRAEMISIDGRECPEIEPDPEICDGLDNDLDGTVDEDDVCGCTDHTYDGHQYSFCDTAVPWNAARHACLARGMDLVKLEDFQETGWLGREAVLPERWLGLSDAAFEGEWRWTDGELADDLYTNWAPLEPGGGLTENCGMMWFGAAWNDLDCSWDLAFVCEE